MFLATTDYQEFWDKTDELLFLGPWCTRYDHRHEWERLKYRFLRNRWDDRERLGSDIAYCARVIEHLADELASYLNGSHKASHEPRYWRILLGLWLYYYVHDLYARYVHVREALEQFPDIRTRSLARSCWITPADTAGHIALYGGDRYPLQLYSQILGALGRGVPEQAAEFPVRVEKVERISASSALKEIAWQWTISMLAHVRPPDILLGDLNFSRRHVWELMRASGFRAQPLSGTLPDEALVKPESGLRREGLKSLKARDEFERVLFSTLPSNFPTVFLEGYVPARDACRRAVNRIPRVLVSSVGWWSNDYLKLVAAECAERGSRLAGFQHGGGYGFSKAATAETLECSVTDRWYAWGWASLAADPKVRDLPHPDISELAMSSPDSKWEQVLYVSTEWHFSLNRLHNYPMEDQYEEYFTWRTKFIEALSEHVADRLLVRLYPEDFGWNQARRLKDVSPDTQLDTDGRTEGFHSRLRQSRLAVFDHPGTSFLEGLASGVPCVLFWKPEHWECRPAAVPYFERLRGAGVLFDDPVAAAGQVQRVYDGAPSWWQTAQVREAREAFVNRFVLTRQDWAKAWVHELMAEAVLATHK